MNNKLNSKVADDKLLILYILKKSNCTLTFEQLSNLILENNFLNYFQFIEYFNELKNSKFFVQSEIPKIQLSDFSIQILELMEDSIDLILREKVDKIFSLDSVSLENPEFQVIELPDGSYLIKLFLLGELDENFALSFSLNDKNQIEIIKNNWLNKNKSIYREFLKILREAK